MLNSTLNQSQNVVSKLCQKWLLASSIQALAFFAPIAGFADNSNSIEKSESQSGKLDMTIFDDLDDHEFAGHHLVVSYLDCDRQAIQNVEQLQLIMEKAVKASGAQILSYNKHVFPGDGLTMVFLLSESHASIHTYPEYGSCFIDLFTCGHKCKPQEFERTLETYLQPGQIDKHYYLRNSETVEETFLPIDN